jgi:hypothetical protein
MNDFNLDAAQVVEIAPVTRIAPITPLAGASGSLGLAAAEAGWAAVDRHLTWFGARLRQEMLARMDDHEKAELVERALSASAKAVKKQARIRLHRGHILPAVGLEARRAASKADAIRGEHARLVKLGAAWDGAAKARVALHVDCTVRRINQVIPAREKKLGNFNKKP